jgi:hypothetical protein
VVLTSQNKFQLGLDRRPAGQVENVKEFGVQFMMKKVDVVPPTVTLVVSACVEQYALI